MAYRERGSLLCLARFPGVFGDRLCMGVLRLRYRTALSTLLPVSYYRLEVVVDEQSGYEAVDQPENQPLVPFYGEMWSEETFFGSCKRSVQKKVE